MPLSRNEISELFPLAIEADIKGLYVIPGWHMYLASPDGRIYSRYINKFMSSTYTKRGWLKVKFQYPGERKFKLMLVHRAIALAFIGPPTDISKRDIDHLDADKENNRPNNLEYVTKKENTDRAQKAGRFKKNFHVRVIDTQSDIVEDFYSIESLRNRFELGRRVMLRILTQHGHELWNNRYLFELLDTGVERDAKVVYSKDYLTGIVVKHGSSQRAAFYHKTTEMRIVKSLKSLSLTDGLVFSHTPQFPEYAREEISFSKLSRRSDARVPLLVKHLNGLVQKYPSIENAALRLEEEVSVLRNHVINKLPYRDLMLSFLACS